MLDRDNVQNISKDSLKLFLGLKLKKIRESKGYSLKEFSEKIQLSPSYLNEIEKGKKYPKADTLLEIANALGVNYNDLASTSVEPEFQYIAEIINSPLLRSFPFDLFGITFRDLFELISSDNGKAGAFVQTILNIARDYDLKTEHFYLSALRAYQEIYNNYFEDLEDKALESIKKFKLSTNDFSDINKLKEILRQEYNYKIIETDFFEYPDLKEFRSIISKGNPNKLYINCFLSEPQKIFVLAREIGYCFLDLKERALTSSWIKVESFDQVLNNFKAGYFAGALLLNKDTLSKDIKKFFKNKKWNGNEFLSLIEKYNTTPETFLYRLSELIPQIFGIKQLHYLRFSNNPENSKYNLTKELNMSKILIPQGIALNEHYCIRWLSVKLLKRLSDEQSKGINNSCIIATQRSNMKETNSDFFCITVAFKSTSSKDNISITLGFNLNEQLKKEVKFWNDPNIENDFINSTCERCNESNCSLRIAPATINNKELVFEVTNSALNEFLKKN